MSSVSLSKVCRTDFVLEQRFWNKVDKTADCWLWKARVSRFNYGEFLLDRKKVLAHRVSYQLHYGPFDYNLQVLHECDNPRCVRPSHLFLGTVQDNMTDKVNKGRQPRGERHFRSKLTEIQVFQIRHLYAQGDVSGRQLGRSFGVSHRAIRAILNRETWRHI